jgi:Ca-activated chloride channel family protein
VATPALSLLRHGFAQPLLLWLMLGLPMLTLLGMLAGWRRRRALAGVGTSLALRPLLVQQGLLARVRHSCFMLGLMLLVLGAAGPQWGQDWEQPVAPGRDLVVVLDMSRSMLAESPSRLQRAREALLELSDSIQQRGGHRLALVVFAARPRVVCPLTHDYDHFRDTVERLDPDNPFPDLGPVAEMASGTRIGAALTLAVQTHDPRFHGLGAQDILLISDGDDPAHDDEWRGGADDAAMQQIPVHTVGVGNPTTASPIPFKDGQQQYQGQTVYTRLEEKALQAIAQRTKGTYAAALTRPLPLGELFRTVIEPRPVREDSDDNLPVHQPRYPWFFGAALLFLTAEMALGMRRPRAPVRERARARAPRAAAAAVLLGLAAAVHPEDLVRQGNEAFAREDYAAAIELYTRAEGSIADPGLVAFNKATALYQLAGSPETTGRRATLYREAELHYRRALEDAVGLRRLGAWYGLGNSLLQQNGRGAEALRGAVHAYEQCLAQAEIDPELAVNVRHNLELAKLLWLQAKAARKDQSAEPPDEQDDPLKRNNPRPEDRGTTQTDKAPAPGGNSGEKVRAQLEPGQVPVEVKQPRAPGTGNLPPVPDTDEMVALPPEDAAEHLQRATARVLHEGREHQKHFARAPAAGVKDW